MDEPDAKGLPHTVANEHEPAIAIAVSIAGPVAIAKRVEDGGQVPAVPNAMADQVEQVPLPCGPPINIVPATPQTSQEAARHVTTVAAPLAFPCTATSLAEANIAKPVSAVGTSVSLEPPVIVDTTETQPLSPHPAPPPPQLCRSPCLLSSALPGLPSRSTTPQPNLKKRAGGSEDGGEAKRGRKE